MVNKEKLDYLRDISKDMILIGNETDREKHLDAVIGYDLIGNRAVYDYDLLVDSFARNLSCTTDEAVDWIVYNVLGSLPNFGEKAPLVIVNINEG